MMGFLGNLFGGIWGYAASATIAGVAAAWVMHAVDGNAYKNLQLADALRVVAQQQADATALARFRTSAYDATEAASGALRASEIQRSAQITKLQGALSVARKDKTHASFADCESVTVPRGVLDSLAH